MDKTRNLFLLLIILFYGCDKHNYKEDSYFYPTTVERLSDMDLSRMKSTFAQMNPSLNTSLNSFGFCSSEWINFQTPPITQPLTESEAIETVRKFIALNPAQTGVKNPKEVTFSKIKFDPAMRDSATYWTLHSSIQKIKGLEVLYTQIIFRIKNRQLIQCIGNWYSPVYLPKDINFNQEKAKALLLNTVVAHYTIAGEKQEIKIRGEDLNGSTARLVIYPVISEEKIELREAWEINIPAPVSYIIYVDALTGETVGSQPTIIS